MHFMNNCHIQCSQSATVSTSRCLVAASNGGRSPFSGFPNYPRPRLTVSDSNSSRLNCSSPLTHQPITTTQSHVTTDGQSASLSWCQAPIWGQRADLYYCLPVAELLMWGALSDERTGLSFTIAAGARQRSHTLIYRL
jgi:hypothetical protein